MLEAKVPGGAEPDVFDGMREDAVVPKGPTLSGVLEDCVSM